MPDICGRELHCEAPLQGSELEDFWLQRGTVAGVSTQRLREKNEVMRSQCLLAFQAEGGRVRSPSGLIVFA